MPADTTTELALRLEGEDDAPAEELDRLTRRLRRELLALDVGDVRRPSGGTAPDGARGVDAAALASLLVSLVSGPDMLRAVVRSVGDWLGRNRARAVYVEIDGDVLEVRGLSSTAQDRLVAEWLARHAGG